MKKTLWLGSILIALPLLLLTASCNKNAVQQQPVTITEPEAPKLPDVPVEEDRSATQVAEKVQPEVPAPAAVETKFTSGNIYFEFDSYILTGQAQQILNRLADHMNANQDLRVTVEGHCDNRGTAEYNLALGERRAEAARKFLVDQGIGSERLNIISYGEERPLAMDNDESSWARNRRDQFVIN